MSGDGPGWHRESRRHSEAALKGRASAPIERAGVDLVGAHELELWIENDANLYRQQYQPIIANLSRKKYKGVYDHGKAVKLFMYLVDEGARRYAKESGGGGPGIPSYFPRPTRLAVAESLTRSFETEFSLGNYSEYKQKYLKG